MNNYMGHGHHPLKQEQGGICDFTIEAVGTGSSSAVPDRAIVTLGAVTEGKSVGAIQQENAVIMHKVSEALKELGIGDDQVGTAQFQIEPVYDYTDGKQTLRGYQVTHLLNVTLHDTSQAGAVIDAAAASGANTVRQVAFEASHPADAQRVALSRAVRDAQDKAAAIASALGVALSAVPCRVEEMQPDSVPPILFKSAMAADSFSTSIEPGQLTYRAAVRVWYMFA